MLKDIWDLLQIVYENRNIMQNLFSSPYLNYDQIKLCHYYQNEKPIYDTIPYSELISWLDKDSFMSSGCPIHIQKLSDNFKLDDSLEKLRDFQGYALNDFQKRKGLSKNSDVIRLNSFEITENACILNIQKAKYSDQVRSNLVMDWDSNHPLKDLGQNTLRCYLLSQFPNMLPPLSDRRLANTIGISSIMFYKNITGNYVPYLPRRAKAILSKRKNLAVFEGGFHCTASGALEWDNDTADSFAEIIMKDMYRELKEEVGIEKNDIIILKPLALCREFLRGGKPQIFFGGIINLSENDIEVKRQLAIQYQKKVDKIEIKDKQLLVSDFEILKKEIPKYGLTLEAVANLYYAGLFLEKQV